MYPVSAGCNIELRRSNDFSAVSILPASTQTHVMKSLRPAISFSLTGALIALLSFSAAYANPGETEHPKYEFRSSWVTTAWGLDWPSGNDPSSQQQQMINILDQLQDQNMNAIVFQASARGDAYYQSERLPWAYNLTGTPGEDPGWDPLQFVIDEARKRGMEVHAWFNAFTTAYASGNDATESADIPNVRFTNPEWMEHEGWMNPGFPEAREWHVENVLEMVENYDIDAVHFDRIRYPGGAYDRDDSLMSVHNPEDISGIDNWRRYNVTEFVRKVHEGIQDLGVPVKVGVTPIGHYDAGSTDSWGAQLGYNSVYQDSRYWAEQGYIDYIAPQVYWDIGGPDVGEDDPDYTHIVNDWVQNKRNDRHIYVGLAPYKSNIRSELGAQIDTSRTAGADGQLYFRNDNIATSGFSGRYDSKALVPPMPWRNMTEPNRVRDLAYDNAGSEITLSWDKPEPPRGEEDPLYRYLVYRVDRVNVLDDSGVIEDAGNIVAITGEPTFTDQINPDEDGDEFTYYVTTASRNNVEGDFVKVEVTPVSSEDERLVAEEVSLDQNYPNPFNPTTSISFSLPQQSHVTIEIFDVTGRLVETVVDEQKSAGSHSITWDASGNASGVYLYRLRAGNTTESRSMILMK